jgi:hypothetical protein
VTLAVSNAATGPSDQLSGQFSAAGDAAFANTGFSIFQDLNAGVADASPEVSLSTAQTGTFSETITLTPTGSNPSGYKAPLATRMFTITGTVLPAPTVTQLAPTPASGEVTVGQTIAIAVEFSSAVTVGGAPTSSLNGGGTAGYASSSGTGTLQFTTTVQPGQNTPELAATSLNVGGGNSIADASSGLAVDLSDLTGTLSGDVSVDGGSAPCFVTGTRIATVTGEVAVETLQAGDRVRLHDGGTAPVVWIGHRRVDCARHPDPALIQPIRIRANALSGGVPSRDLPVSPDHALFIGGMLIVARLLRSGQVVTRMAMDDPALHRGWWQVEIHGNGPCRWTDGQALLPVAESGVPEVELAGSMRYTIDRETCALVGAGIGGFDFPRDAVMASPPRAGHRV